MLSRRARRNAIGLGLLALPLAVVASVFVYIQYRKTHVTTDDAFVDAVIYYVSPRISGRVAELLIEDNQYVRLDDLLVRLDPSDIEANLRIAEANLAEVRRRPAGHLQSGPATGEHAGLQ